MPGRWFLIPIWCVALWAGCLHAADPFVVKPYLQLGDRPRPFARESLELFWHSEDLDARWSVEIRLEGSRRWKKLALPASIRIVVAQVMTHDVWRVRLTGLKPDARFEYRILRGGEEVFRALGRSPKSVGRPLRIAVEGDTGFQENPGKAEGPRAIAYQLHLAAPDLLVIPGDWVYARGTIREYRQRFFPFYNSDQASPQAGAPLMRSVVFAGGLGEHDWGQEDARFDRAPDLFAWFFYMSMPLNGPTPAGGYPYQGISAEQKRSLLQATGPRYARMATYSFDYGDTHWVVLDTWNPHLDWHDRGMREWLRRDLTHATTRWKFVVSYLPPFVTSKDYPQVQKMRAVVDIIQQCGVDMVFSGYVHSYQRSKPLHFQLATALTGPLRHYNQVLDGHFTFDEEFDGISVRKPSGVLYINSGAGGAQLHNPEQTGLKETWLPFTARLESNRHSFTLLDIDGNKLVLRQIASDGAELDRVEVEK